MQVINAPMSLKLNSYNSQGNIQTVRSPRVDLNVDTKDLDLHSQSDDRSSNKDVGDVKLDYKQVPVFDKKLLK